MRKMLVMSMVGAMLAINPSAALADEACTGSVGAVTIEDNLVVPSGAICILDGTTIQGNVLVEPGATLRATNVTVQGNVQTNNSGAIEVTLVSAHVGGDFQVFDGLHATVIDGDIDGNIQLDANDGDLTVDATTVNGDVQLFNNDGGHKEITNNTIDGNLQCKENDPAPVGGNNVVGGNAEDQCADLEGTTSGTRFQDVADDHVFATEIVALANAGITVGCNPPANDRYCPDDKVTRGQMAAFLDRALSLPAGSASFDDVGDDNVFANDIAALAGAGITIGCNPPANDRYCPDDNVTRGQMAAFLVRAGLTS